MSSFLSISDFQKRYPETDSLLVRKHTIVYRSGSHLIKWVRFLPDEVLILSCIRELTVYTQVQHPCIGRMVHWTFSGDSFRLALIAGEWVDTQVDIHQLVGDLLSGLSALHSIGMCHNDIKRDNIIFLDGHIALIDFGLLAPIERGYIRYARYTLTHRDPRVYFINQSDEYPVSQTVDSYPVGVIAMELFENYRVSNPNTYPPIECTSSLLIQDLLKGTTIEDLFRIHPDLSRVSGNIEPTRSICSVPSEEITSQIVEVMTCLENRPRTIQNAISLLRRCSYPNRKGVSFICMILSQLILIDNIYSFELISQSLDLSIPDLKALCIDILIEVNGQLIYKCESDPIGLNSNRESPEMISAIIDELQGKLTAGQSDLEKIHYLHSILSTCNRYHYWNIPSTGYFVFDQFVRKMKTKSKNE